MIINTIILFLRDLLPLFIILSYLCLFIKNKNIAFSYFYPALILGFISSILFFIAAPYISELFEGTGIERCYVALLLITYCCLFLISTSTLEHQFSLWYIKVITLTGIAAFITFKASTFLLFFNVYFQQQESAVNIFIGCIVGLAICASFSTLFTFVLTELIDLNKSIINTFWALFLAGQVVEVITYMSQVDLLHVGPPAVNLSAFIRDDSEYGHVLKALLGYEESPSTLFLILYTLALALPTIFTFILKSIRTPSRENKNHDQQTHE